jgi:hypothetical protein
MVAKAGVSDIPEMDMVIIAVAHKCFASLMPGDYKQILKGDVGGTTRSKMAIYIGDYKKWAE